MSLDTYTNLKAEIIKWLDRDDLNDSVDTFIDLAEARHQREVRIRDMLVRDPLTVVSRYANVPSGYLEAKTLRLLTTPRVTELGYLNLHEMNERRVETPNDQPCYFTIHAQIEFDRIPDKAYSGEIIYYKKLSALSTTNATNALLARSPGSYLWGALASSAPFLNDDERITLWNSLYENDRDAINTMDLNARQVGPLVSQVSGWTP